MRVSRISTVMLFLLPSAGLAAFAAGPMPLAQREPARLATHEMTSAIGYHNVIEPFLKSECTGCHSAAGHASGLNLETPESLFKGGDKFGAKIVVAGKSDES